MSAETQRHRDYVLAVGLLMGTCIGVVLTMWLAPRTASELRERLADSVSSLVKRAGQPHQQAYTSIGETAEELTRRDQGVRDNIAEAVSQRAQAVERYATAAKSRVTESRKRSATDRPASKRVSL